MANNRSIAGNCRLVKQDQIKLQKFIKNLHCEHCEEYSARRGQRYLCKLTGYRLGYEETLPLFSSETPCLHTEKKNCPLLIALSKDEILEQEKNE